jgi:hypothetical protein
VDFRAENAEHAEAVSRRLRSALRELGPPLRGIFNVPLPRRPDFTPGTMGARWVHAENAEDAEKLGQETASALSAFCARSVTVRQIKCLSGLELSAVSHSDERLQRYDAHQIGVNQIRGVIHCGFR